MTKLTKAKAKDQAIDQIIAEFVKQGHEFSCLASFNQVRDYARFVAHKLAVDHGFVYSTSMYFPQINSGDNLQFWAAKKYLKELYPA